MLTVYSQLIKYASYLKKKQQLLANLILHELYHCDFVLTIAVLIAVIIQGKYYVTNSLHKLIQVSDTLLAMQ